MTGEKFNRLGWEAVLHPPYSADIASPSYYFFQSVPNYLNEETFQNEADFHLAVLEYLSFLRKLIQFYQETIASKPNKVKSLHFFQNQIFLPTTKLKYLQFDFLFLCL